MKVFISYASAQRSTAEPLALALEGDGHDVFFDRTDLPRGEGYHERIRSAIYAADRFVFLVSPESVRAGSYALSELSMAQARWPRPAGRVLPVMAAPTPYADIPPYAAAVTVLEPKGNLAAEVAATLARRRMSARIGWWAGAAAALVAIGAFGAWQWQVRREEANARQEQLAQRQREVRAASDVCKRGSPTAAWTQLDALAGTPGVEAARGDCAMQWLRELAVGKDETFSQVVDRLLPVLTQGIAAATGPRLADLHAHIGWAEFLRERDGKPAQPLPHYQRAIEVEAHNPFGNAMAAHFAAWHGEPEALVAARFDAALASGREREYVRKMQVAVAQNRARYMPGVIASLNAGRKAGEAPPADAVRFYQRWCEWELLVAPEDRPALLAALPADDALATIAWLQPFDAVLPNERKPLWRLCRSAYLFHEGRHVEGEAIVREVLQSLGPQAAGGSYERWAKQQLAGATGPLAASTPRPSGTR